MSDLTATNCGCNSNRSNNCGCFGGNSCWWIIILLFFCNGNISWGTWNRSGEGCGCDNDNNGCCSMIWILLLLFFCNGNGCSNGCC